MYCIYIYDYIYTLYIYNYTFIFFLHRPFGTFVAASIMNSKGCGSQPAKSLPYSTVKEVTVIALQTERNCGSGSSCALDGTALIAHQNCSAIIYIYTVYHVATPIMNPSPI